MAEDAIPGYRFQNDQFQFVTPKNTNDTFDFVPVVDQKTGNGNRKTDPQIDDTKAPEMDPSFTEDFSLFDLG